MKVTNSFIIDQLEGHQRLNGYKLLHISCIQAGYVVPQSTVRHLLTVQENNMKLEPYMMNIFTL